LSKMKKEKKSQKELNLEKLQAGISIVYSHPLFGQCLFYPPNHYGSQTLGSATIGIVESSGSIILNHDADLTPAEWAYVIAHNMLHRAFGHFDAKKMPGYINEKGKKIISCDPFFWNMACDIYVDRFLTEIKFGQPIHPDTSSVSYGSMDDEEKIYQKLLEQNPLTRYNPFGTAAPDACDMKGLEKPLSYEKDWHPYNQYTKTFTYALAHSVSQAVSEAGGHTYQNIDKFSDPQKAARWFVDHYPLLGGLASHFKVIEDYRYCNEHDISIAAVDAELGEIYVNPASPLSFEEWKFVLAHEYLHAGLMHHERCQGRDPYLWNVACDYVINGWLSELAIGSMPSDGLLYDAALKDDSAEEIYDRILTDIRKYKKLDTFRGFHKGDILGSSKNTCKTGISLDEFCRNALSQGLEYHVSTGRGYVPAGLVQEIRALSMPPIPWDVALARWFDVYFAPLEKHQTYARPSRRQASTPDIPRPRYVPADIPTDSRTFGVVIDTSGSMNAEMIGRALGSVASYAVAHDVPFARVIFCDACAYDAGYLSPYDIAGRVQVKGRGGTRLQPGIDALEHAKDFPKDGPILIITDGMIEDHLDIRHVHAYLLPRGKRLPFKPKGEVFYFHD